VPSDAKRSSAKAIFYHLPGCKPKDQSHKGRQLQKQDAVRSPAFSYSETARTAVKKILRLFHLKEQANQPAEYFSITAPLLSLSAVLLINTWCFLIREVPLSGKKYNV